MSVATIGLQKAWKRAKKAVEEKDKAKKNFVKLWNRSSFTEKKEVCDELGIALHPGDEGPEPENVFDSLNC